jgi:hypothetical protein
MRNKYLLNGSSAVATPAMAIRVPTNKLAFLGT